MDLSRRKFIITGSAAASAALAFGSCKSGGRAEPAALTSENPPRSRVALSRNPELFPLGKHPCPETVKQILDQTIAAFAGIPAADYFSHLFNPGDKVSLKINCLSGRSMSTHRKTTQAVIELLQESGLPPDNITVWDRKEQDLLNAGYTINKGKGVKFIGVDTDGYDSGLTAHRSIGSFFARILSKTDKIISLPVLKDHGIVGVTLGMKNFFGAIHNPNKYHIDAGNPYVADLYSHPLIKDKVVLTIIDGIAGQYEGGPPPMPQWQWNCGGFVIGTDPVAVDRIGLKIIEEQRALHKIPSLTEASRFPEYLKTAEKLGLGNFDLNKIEVIEV